MGCRPYGVLRALTLALRIPCRVLQPGGGSGGPGVSVVLCCNPRVLWVLLL